MTKLCHDVMYTNNSSGHIICRFHKNPALISTVCQLVTLNGYFIIGLELKETEVNRFLCRPINQSCRICLGQTNIAIHRISLLWGLLVSMLLTV